MKPRNLFKKKQLGHEPKLISSDTRGSTAAERIEWLRSQLIGRDEEFDTPIGRRLLTYADHTASGRCLHYIENYITQQVLPFYGNTHTNDNYAGEKTTRKVNEATEYIRKCLGAGPDDALIFCGSGATAAIKRLQEVMGIAVPATIRDRVVENLREEERWVVFVGPFEHHSNLLSWRQSAAEVVEIGVDGDGMLDLEALELELSSVKYRNRPMLGSFSACSNVTGIITDTRALARLLHKHGAFACYDFASSGPYVEIDMRSGDIEGYDAIFLSPHKFIGGPGSPGILVMNKALYLLRSSPPSTCGGGVVGYANGFNSKDTLYYHDIEEREDAGTPPIIQKIRAALAFWVKESVGYDVIDLNERIYIQKATERLLKNPGIQILGNSHAKKLSILSFLVFTCENSASCRMENQKPLHGRFVAKLLNDLFGIQARGGCACSGPYGHYLLGVDESLSLSIRSHIQMGYSGLKPGWTRVSFAYYITNEEFSFILDAIEFIASYGHRFLSMYQFDWVTGDWKFLKCALKYHFKQEEILMEENNGFHCFQLAKNRASDGDIKSSTKNNFGCLQNYINIAKKIALSLPENPIPMSIPDGVDPNVIFFRI